MSNRNAERPIVVFHRLHKGIQWDTIWRTYWNVRKAWSIWKEYTNSLKSVLWINGLYANEQWIKNIEIKREV